MIRRRICYLLLLAAGINFIMLYNFQGLRFLFCCILCIPLVSFFFLIPLKVCCRIRLEAEQEEVVRGERPKIRVAVENRGILPMPGVMLELRWMEPGGGERKSRRWLRGMGPHARETFLPELSASHCGLASLAAARANVYDYLGIFALSAGGTKIAEVCVLPSIEPVPYAVEAACSQILRGMGEEKEGDLLLRDFQPGDSLHRVYWKMLAKGGELLQVRDFERSGSMILYLRFSAGLKEQADQWDRYLDRAASLLYFFAEECRIALPVSVEVVWQRGDGFYRYQVPDSAAVHNWLSALLRGERIGESLAEEEIFFLERGWRLEEDCRLYFGEQCVYEG